MMIVPASFPYFLSHEVIFALASSHQVGHHKGHCAQSKALLQAGLTLAALALSSAHSVKLVLLEKTGKVFFKQKAQIPYYGQEEASPAVITPNIKKNLKECNRSMMMCIGGPHLAF